MNKLTFMKKFALWLAVGIAVIMLIVGLCFGKVIEESLFGEIAKWVLLTLGIIGICEVFAFTVGQAIYDYWYSRKHKIDDDAA